MKIWNFQIDEWNEKYNYNAGIQSVHDSKLHFSKLRWNDYFQFKSSKVQILSSFILGKTFMEKERKFALNF